MDLGRTCARCESDDYQASVHGALCAHHAVPTVIADLVLQFADCYVYDCARHFRATMDSSELACYLTIAKHFARLEAVGSLSSYAHTSCCPFPPGTVIPRHVMMPLITNHRAQITPTRHNQDSVSLRSLPARIDTDIPSIGVIESPGYLRYIKVEVAADLMKALDMLPMETRDDDFVLPRMCVFRAVAISAARGTLQTQWSR